MNNPNLNPDEQQSKAKLRKYAFLGFGLFIAGFALNIWSFSFDIYSLQSILLMVAGFFCYITAIILFVVQVRRMRKEGIVKGQFQQQDLKQRLKILLPSIIILAVVNVIVDSSVDSDSPLSFIVPLITAIVLLFVWYVTMKKSRGKELLQNEGFPEDQIQKRKKYALVMILFMALISCIIVYWFEQPHTATDYFDRAADSFNSRNYTQALSYANKSIEHDSNYTMAYELRGFVYNNLGEFSQAIAEFNQSIALGLNDAIVYCERGKAYMSLNETEQSIADFQKCLTLNPDLNTSQVAQTNLQKLGVTIYAQ